MSIQKNKNKNKSADCVVAEDHIYFPKGYCFKYGFLKNKKKLPFSIIDEIRTNTFPVTAKINTNEIIFLQGLDEKKCIEIKEKSNISLTTPVDNWSLLCDEFLDTECSNEQQEDVIQLLMENGINRDEVNGIRKRISSRMLILTFFSWEWMYYGQFDVLKQLWPLNQKKYWWTMEIALRSKKD
ncbi:hypothetical protein ATE84_2079 [Aquimarina sp. MAR_2010_214]|uniref:hypothetical protein n=1 Tax=Aquimarina sp. MAR_2010_214 TaxID=1250026 RepID=UPI000C710E81|nr:hypothetical protein [Aquimarina sp. MAR_2010_214]PKV50033.1 hypothetical protein ATE84_2079 [Aquimarina sp. MAR_2010_214]